MNRFKIVFFMMTAMICIATTSWGDSISLNNNNDFIVVTVTDACDLTFEMGKINTDTVSPQFFPETQISKLGWGKDPTFSLNDNNTFIEANLGADSNKIYYNAGKIDPVTHKITFTDTGFSFNNNDGQTPSIYLNNNNNFIEVHEGASGVVPRIVKTKKFPFYKIILERNLYYVTGKIDNDGKIVYLNTGKYCSNGESPIITTIDDNVFTEIHVYPYGPDPSRPYSTIPYAINGSVDGEGNFLSTSGEGIEVSGDYGQELVNQNILAVRMTRTPDPIHAGDYYVNLFTEGKQNIITQDGYLHILKGSDLIGAETLWTSYIDIPVTGNVEYAAANDKYFICYLSVVFGSYKVIPYNPSGN